MADLTALIKTPRGDINLKLFPDQAPLTVANPKPAEWAPPRR